MNKLLSFTNRHLVPFMVWFLFFGSLCAIKMPAGYDWLAYGFLAVFPAVIVGMWRGVSREQKEFTLTEIERRGLAERLHKVILDWTPKHPLLNKKGDRGDGLMRLLVLTPGAAMGSVINVDAPFHITRRDRLVLRRDLKAQTGYLDAMEKAGMLRVDLVWRRIIHVAHAILDDTLRIDALSALIDEVEADLRGVAVTSSPAQ